MCVCVSVHVSGFSSGISNTSGAHQSFKKNLQRPVLPASQPVSHRFLAIEELRHSNRQHSRDRRRPGAPNKMFNSQAKKRRGRHKESQSSVTQSTSGDLLQHEREKVIEAERVSKPALCLPHINTFVLELCQCHCAMEKNDSGVRFTTMGHGSDVFDRGCVVAHEGYVGLEAARAHVRTGLAAAKSKVCDYAQDARVVSLMSPHVCCSV